MAFSDWIISNFELFVKKQLIAFIEPLVNSNVELLRLLLLNFKFPLNELKFKFFNDEL